MSVYNSNLRDKRKRKLLSRHAITKLVHKVVCHDLNLQSVLESGGDSILKNPNIQKQNFRMFRSLDQDKKIKNKGITSEGCGNPIISLDSFSSVPPGPGPGAADRAADREDFKNYNYIRQACVNPVKYARMMHHSPGKPGFTKIRNRCVLSGRGKSVYRFCRFSRIRLRDLAGKGLLSGVCKASW